MNVDLYVHTQSYGKKAHYYGTVRHKCLGRGHKMIGLTKTRDASISPPTSIQ